MEHSCWVRLVDKAALTAFPPLAGKVEVLIFLISEILCGQWFLRATPYRRSVKEHKTVALANRVAWLQHNSSP